MVYVYFIHADDEENLTRCAIKIGIAQDIQSRISALQIGNHNTIKLWKSLVFPSYDLALYAEKKIHKWLKPYNIRGEWFQCNSIAYDVLNYIISVGFPGCINQMNRVSQFIRILYDNPKFESIDFPFETIIYGDGGFHFTAALDTPLGSIDRED